MRAWATRASSEGSQQMSIRRMSAWAWIVVVAAAFQIVLTREAQAYIDPGSVSFMFQSLVAAVLGGLLVVRHYWTRITAKIGGWLSPEDEDEDD